ncbi:MAG: hypothetical protein H0T44_06015 [Gemmatimonadales bacterium]|nr:hypothetical protein [Gemmatimonadales bacterium]
MDRGRLNSLWPLTLSVVVALPAGGAAQVSATAASSRHDTPATVLKTALRSVTASQARYRQANGAFAADLNQLDVRPDPTVRVEILAAGAVGWQAKAVHSAQLGRSCVIFVGKLDGVDAPRTDADREMAGEEGVPLCDRMR